MTTVAEALESGGLRWRRIGDGEWELVGGDDTLGRLRGDQVELGQRVLRLETNRTEIVLVDVARESIVGKIRITTYGVGVLFAANHRLRISRERHLPPTWQMTIDIGGPQVLRMAKIGRSLRFRPGAAYDDVARRLDVDMLALFAAVMLLRPAAAPAAAA